MEGAVARIVGRDLTMEERQLLIQLRDQYGYDDTDPLVVVLAMTGAIKIIAEDIPNKIKTATTELTELHRMALRQESVTVAKSIVEVVAKEIHSAGAIRKRRIFDALIGGVAGFATAAVFAAIFWKFIPH